MGIELDIARRRKIDQVVDLESAISGVHLFRRLDAPPNELLDRLDELGLREKIKAHFDRLKEEPDFDQRYALERIETLRQSGGTLFLTGPAGSGKTEVLLIYRKSSAGRGGVVVTASTNQAKNVLRSRGEESAMTMHQALYGSPTYDPDHVAEIIDFIKKDGNFELSPAVDNQLASAWRAATPGPRERAAREVTGIPTDNQVSKALAMLGLGQGLMHVLKPQWNVGEQPDDADLWVVDEASMISDANLSDVQARASSVLLVGDVFQLPPVVDEEDRRAGRRGALATIPLSQQVHLYHDRRVQSASQHLEIANKMLSERYGLADLVSWARSEKYRGLTLTNSYDGRVMMTAPVLCYYRKTVKRLAVSYRQQAGLPDDNLIPGDRLLIDVVPRDLRDELAAKGIGKNVRVVVLEQRSIWQVVVIAEAVFNQLTAEGAGAETFRAHAIALVLSVQYPAHELQEAGVRLTETLALNGLVLAKGQAVQASLASASTTHKAQGAAFPTAVVMMDDLFGYARSQYGNEVQDDLPTPLWRRVAYTAMTRATERVELVIEGSSQRTLGARLRNMPTEADIRATLPESIRPDLHAELLAELRELDTVETPQQRRPAAADAFAPGLSWPDAGSNVTPLRPSVGQTGQMLRALQQSSEQAEPSMLDPSLAAFAVTLLGKSERMILPAGDGEGRMLELGRSPTGSARMRVHSRNDGPGYWEPLVPNRPVRSTFRAIDLEMAEAALRRFQKDPDNAFRGMTRCGVCGRGLEDPVSRALGIGPICAGRLGIRFELPENATRARKEAL